MTEPHTTAEGQRRFIESKEPMINRETAVRILQVILQDAGWSGESSEPVPDAWAGIILESRTGTDINLTALADLSPRTLATVYGIVRARVAALSVPASRVPPAP
jgi:hypothetical protein